MIWRKHGYPRIESALSNLRVFYHGIYDLEHIMTSKYLSRSFFFSSFNKTVIIIIIINNISHNIILPFSFIVFQTSDKSTAFHLACAQGSMEIVKLLASYDLSICRITLLDAEGQTPLHRAATNNHVSVVEYLLDQVGKICWFLMFYFFFCWARTLIICEW